MSTAFRVSWCALAAIAVLATGGGITVPAHAAAPDASFLKYPFEDTPANRELAEKARQRFEQINKEHGHFVDLGDIRMHYLEWGDESGVPLIWTPGLTGTGMQLMIAGPQLAGAGYHVYAISIRAHGLTETPTLDFSYYTVADDIERMMDRLKMKCAVIGGSSLGGWVTAAFYDEYSQRTLGLILGDGGTYPRQAQLEVLYADYMKAHPDASGTIASDWSYDDPFLAFQSTLNERLQDLSGAVLTEMLPFFWSTIKRDAQGHYIPATPADALLGSMPDYIDPAVSYRMPLLQRSFRAMLPEVIFRNLDVPTIIIEPKAQTFGDPTEANTKLVKQHPDLITRIEYPDTPHPFLFVHPEWVVRDLTNFLPRMREQLKTRPGCRP